MSSKMSSEKIRKLLYEEFERRIDQLVQLAQRIKLAQSLLEQRVKDLIKVYGEEVVKIAIEELGIGIDVDVLQKGFKTKSRLRGSSRHGTKIRETLKRCISLALEELKQEGANEFTARMIYEKTKRIAKEEFNIQEISYSKFSFELRRISSELGIYVIRKEKHPRLSIPINIFGFVYSDQPQHEDKIPIYNPKKNRVDWIAGIKRILQQGPLPIYQIKMTLQSLGVPKKNLRGGGFYNALKKMVQKGIVIREGDKYKLRI